MRIAYFTTGDITRLPSGDYYSPMASNRYRICLPAKYLRAKNYEIETIKLDPRELQGPAALADAADCDVAVIGKITVVNMAEIVRSLRKRRVSIVVDFCDNYFSHERKGPIYKDLAASADHVVANSQLMAEEIERLTSRKAEVIFDPVEGGRNEASLNPQGNTFRFVWYGFPMGLAFLFDRLDDWINSKSAFQINLEIITAVSDGLMRRAEDLNERWRDRCQIKLTSWSLSAVKQGIRSADAVLIPSDLNETTKTKSPNRLVEAIYGGRLAVASPLPSYIEFGQFCCLQEDLDSIEAALGGGAATIEKIRAGQNYIAERYLPAHAAAAWDKVFRSLGKA